MRLDPTVFSLLTFDVLDVDVRDFKKPLQMTLRDSCHALAHYQVQWIHR